MPHIRINNGFSKTHESTLQYASRILNSARTANIHVSTFEQLLITSNPVRNAHQAARDKNDNNTSRNRNELPQTERDAFPHNSATPIGPRYSLSDTQTLLDELTRIEIPWHTHDTQLDNTRMENRARTVRSWSSVAPKQPPYPHPSHSKMRHHANPPCDLRLHCDHAQYNGFNRTTRMQLRRHEMNQERSIRRRSSADTC